MNCGLWLNVNVVVAKGTWKPKKKNFPWERNAAGDRERNKGGGIFIRQTNRRRNKESSCEKLWILLKRKSCCWEFTTSFPFSFGAFFHSRKTVEGRVSRRAENLCCVFL